MSCEIIFDFEVIVKSIEYPDDNFKSYPDLIYLATYKSCNNESK